MISDDAGDFYGYDDTFDDERESEDTLGCVFPGKCLMPGLHLESECHTVEMFDRINEGEEQ